MRYKPISQAVLVASQVPYLENLALNLTFRPCLYPICTKPYLDVAGELRPASGYTKDEPILSQMLLIGNIPIQPYNASTMTTSDDLGQVGINYADSGDGKWRYFYLNRSLDGPLRFSYRVYPREVTRATPPGPRQDIRYEPNGFNGGIMGLGPMPPLLPTMSDVGDLIDVAVNWDLAQSPKSSSGVWSLGNRSDPTHHGSTAALYQAFFAVGELLQYPQTATPDETLTVYYFSQPPFDLPPMANATIELFTKLASFFQDPFGLFTVLLRSNPNCAFGGSGGTRSFLIEYCASMSSSQFDDLTQILGHELIHNWALILDPAKSASDTPAELNERYSGWYVEGIARYYQFVLAYRFGMIERKELLDSLNRLSVSYYTSPAVNLSYTGLEQRMWSDWHSLEMIYTRGAMHFLDVSGRISAAIANSPFLTQPKSKIRLSQFSTVDDIVVELSQLRAQGQDVTEIDYLSRLASVLGENAARNVYTSMANGTLIVPIQSSMNGSQLPPFGLRRHDQEKFELGFDRDSLRIGSRIQGLIPSSRAKEAGLQEGDLVLSIGGFGDSLEVPGQKIILEVCRNGEQDSLSFGAGQDTATSSNGIDTVGTQLTCTSGGRKIEFLPRAKGFQVECWEWYDRQG